MASRRFPAKSIVMICHVLQICYIPGSSLHATIKAAAYWATIISQLPEVEEATSTGKNFRNHVHFIIILLLCKPLTHFPKLEIYMIGIGFYNFGSATLGSPHYIFFFQFIFELVWLNSLKISIENLYGCRNDAEVSFRIFVTGFLSYCCE